MPGLGSPGLGHRIEKLFATRLLMIWHLEFAIGRPTPSKGHREHEVLFETATIGAWFSDLHLVTFATLVNDGHTPNFRA